MAAVLEALVPIFVLIGLGYAFAAHGFPEVRFWLGAERLAYYVLFPPLLIRHLARAQVVGPVIGPLAGVVAITVLSLASFLFVFRMRIPADGPAFSSVFQGSVRFNTFVGLAATASLYSTNGLAVASLLLALLIPLVNVLSVTVLAHSGRTGSPKPSVGSVLRTLMRNPLILGCLGGIVLNLSGAGLPGALDTVLAPLARAALPVGLLVVGSGFSPGAVRGAGSLVGLSSVLKLVVSPVVATAACLVLGLHGTPAAVVVLFSALPGASSAYILAGQMGGDRSLMAAILTVQTALAAVTLPAAIVLSAALLR